MELQDTRFMRFMKHFWIKYHKFRGASRICAIFLNFFILVLKLVFCGGILLMLAPHLAASALRNKRHLNIFQGLLYILCVAISLVLDVPLMLMCIMCALATWHLLMQGQLLTALMCGLTSWGIMRVEKLLLRALFCGADTAQPDSVDSEEEDEPIEYELEEMKRILSSASYSHSEKKCVC